MVTTRKKRCCLLIACCLSLMPALGCASSQSSDLSEWVGEYTYGYIAPGPNVSGTYVTANYEIAIYEEDGAYFATFDAGGWMLHIEIKTQVLGNQSTIELMFVEGHAFLYSFEPGDVIVELTRDGDDLITKWVGLEPYSVEDITEGLFFIKTDVLN